MKVAIYARYSSDNQRDASIADQLRICRLHAEKQGWQVVEEYTDHAISGASLLRPGIQALGCVDKRDSQISRGLIQGFFFGGGSLGLSERCERRCVGDH